MTSLLLIITPIIVASLMMLLGKRTRILERLALIAALVEGAAALGVAFGLSRAAPFAPYIVFDALGSFFVLITGVLGSLGLIYAIYYFRKEGEMRSIRPESLRNYHVLYQLFLLSMFVAAGANHVLLLWIAVEATTLSSAFLVNFFDRPAAIEAAWKYMIINTVALLLGLFGVYLFIGVVQYAAFTNGLVVPFDWAGMRNLAAFLDPSLTKLAFVFLLIGYGTKAGLAPLHNWLPDAHSQAPVPISAMLSGALLNIALLALLRFKSIIDIAVGSHFIGTLFLCFGTLSILFAAFRILLQKEYKRLFAYSSIEHMGIIVFGFGLGGVAVAAALLHTLYHSLAKATLFLSSGNIALRYHTLEIAKVSGLLRTLPVTGVLFLGAILALSGIPPFGTFFTEFMIFAVGFLAHPYFSTLAFLGLTLAFVGMFRHAGAMFYGVAHEGTVHPEQKTTTVMKEQPLSYAPILLLFALLVVLSFFLFTPLRMLIIAAANSL
jgi:hydrogenase-4 component F